MDVPNRLNRSRTFTDSMPKDDGGGVLNDGEKEGAELLQRDGEDVGITDG